MNPFFYLLFDLREKNDITLFKIVSLFFKDSK